LWSGEAGSFPSTRRRRQTYAEHNTYRSLEDSLVLSQTGLILKQTGLVLKQAGLVLKQAGPAPEPVVSEARQSRSS
jgi:hypothetical protein